jgi:hypothetical protein
MPLALVIAAAPACAGTLTCEAQGDRRHCWNERGETVVTKERQGEHVHGHDNRGGAWTTWTHDGHTETWLTR